MLSLGVTAVGFFFDQTLEGAFVLGRNLLFSIFSDVLYVLFCYVCCTLG